MARITGIITLLLFFCINVSAQNNYAQYVNPFIGTGGHGHTYPGATLPHGMVQLSPDTRLDGWDGCGGYHYSDSFIYGFTHTHLSGTGVSDYGDILLMPMNGKPSPDNKVYGSLFSHANEKATAGYYSVQLEDDHIQTEFTASERVGFHHYRFAKAEENTIILDLKHRDEVIESSIQIEDSVTITGSRRSKAWALNQYVYFVIKFSKPIKNYGVWENEILAPPRISSFGNSKNLKAFFQFDLSSSNDVYIKVAISPVSVEGAKKNLATEISSWDFESVKKEAERKWNIELARIEVKEPDSNKLAIFYTALYHTAVVPNINMDVDGQYRGMDGKIHTAQGFIYYSVFSLWDTYRGTHPLYTIIDRKRTLDYIQTFLVQYKQGGRLPVWELASCETDCMIGYHSIPVIFDAYQKGITEFDTQLALEAMEKSANRNVLGLPAYIGKGVIESEDEAESVSKTLEYAYDDWCIAMFAKELGNNKKYLQYIKRAQYYKNVLDLQTGFMRPRKNGDWLRPFDPREVNNNFTEANSWQYSFYMPQDIEGYIRMIGGNDKLENKLDSLFVASSQITGRDQSDITGLIGQYAHGNEPSHHIIYLYDYTAKPFKTQRLIHQVMTEMYHNAPDGLIGNEDCGQMSAWYVLSALGFYPVTPGSGNYMIGSPQFSEAVINLENGEKFIIQAPRTSKDDFYIQNSFLRTAASPKSFKWDAYYLKHKDIADGGLVSFTMGNKPAAYELKKQAATDIANEPGDFSFIVNPVINGGPAPFKQNREVTISTSQKNANIYYSMDGSVPTSASTRYLRPLLVDKSLTLKAIAIDLKGNKSFVTTATYKKMSHEWSVKLNTAYEQQYDAGGADGLIDEIRGTTDWHKGNWQGYQKTPMEVVIDLKDVKYISKVTAGFLQDTRAWIVLPKQLLVELSLDGNNYIPAFTGEDFLPIDDLNIQVKNVEAIFPTTAARYVRIKALQYGKLPSWHEGAGGDTHIFVDEIGVE
ncbi:MAG: glycoside hydrolase family 92 protein [Ferruginibacter sp.]|nr:glycoside hydrolase family 92 protein [Ferruginibacter sp.]